MVTIGEALAEARRRLAAAPFRPEGREANLLLGHVTRRSEAQIIARPDRTLDDAELERFRALVDRRLAGEPIAYILGVKEFYGRPFRVDRRVLIPRPETEHLIEVALELALPRSPRILDLGTGSGIVACTLAAEIPGARVVASDISIGALAVARANARDLGLEGRLAFVGADLSGGLDPTVFDLVVSNPPYVGTDDAHQLSMEIVRYEPHTALFAGTTGLSLYRRLIDELESLPSGRPLIVEIGADQQPALDTLTAGSCFRLVEVRRDLAGRHRIALLERR